MRYWLIFALLGSAGRERPVRGIFQGSGGGEGHGLLPYSEPEEYPEWLPHWDRDEGEDSVVILAGSISLSGRGGVSNGLPFVSFSRQSLHNALTASNTMTTFHRIFSPRRRAAISHSSSVYWIMVIMSARRLYIGDFCVQNFVYRLWGVGFAPGPTLGGEMAWPRRESW